jgi:hypothetical protein
VETAAEVLTIANSAIDRVNNIGDRWENSGSNFSERLRNSIHQAGENITQSYARISRNIGERVQNFRQDVEDYSLGDAIGNRIHEAMINVQDMVVEATDFVSELPLRSRIAKNTIRARIELQKMDSVGEVAELMEGDGKTETEIIEIFGPAMIHMTERYVEFKDKADNSKLELALKIRGRSELRRLRDREKIRALTSSMITA